MHSQGMRSFDSRNTEPEPHKAPQNNPKMRKLSMEDIETDNENVFGIFTLDDYTVMRGFVPGKGKNTRLHYTKI